MTNEEIFAATSVSNWVTATSRLEKILAPLKDEDLQLQVAPGRNRVYYIVGHLAAVSDLMLPLLGLGERLYPELDEFFISNPDRSKEDKYSGAELRKILTEVNTKVAEGMKAMPAADFLKPHSAVSEEDFQKQPLRNRLAVFE